MRALILKMSISIDGFVASADSGGKWIFDTYDDEAAAWTVRTIRDASLHIMGSRTFHDMAAYWPTSTAVFAPPMNEIPKAVFSRRGPVVLKAADTTEALKDARVSAGHDPSAKLQPGADSWGQPYVASGDLAEEIRKLKA
jgi:dihydrofolate reductase